MMQNTILRQLDKNNYNDTHDFIINNSSEGFLKIYNSWLNNQTTKYEKQNNINVLFHEFIVNEDDVKVIITYTTNKEPGIIMFFRVVKNKDIWFYVIPTDLQLKAMQYVTNTAIPIVEKYSINR